MIEKNLVSIICVCYNDIENLKFTLKSIFEQQMVLFELIVVDGASTDGTVDYLKSYALPSGNFIYISEPDEGIYFAINKGINIASSDYLIVMNVYNITNQ